MWGRERLEGVFGGLRAVQERLATGFRTVGERFPRATAFTGGIWTWVREEPLVGIGLSVLLHVLIIWLVIYLGGPGSTYNVKRGEPLFVELPEIKDQAPRGNPAAREPGPPAAPSPPPTPAPVAAPPAPRPQPPAPRVAEARPRAPEPPRAAPEPPRPAPPAERPAPRPAEPPPPADTKDVMPAPVQQARPAPPTPAPPAQTSPSPGATASGPAAPSSPAPPASATAGGPSGPQVASIPPGSREPVFDLRSLGRGGGAGGRGEGRGGIEGEPIPLDTRDPRYSDYLDRIRRMIKERWGYPCVKSNGTGQCEYKTAELVIEFGIAKDGKVPFVNLVRTSGYSIYDDYALNAIKLASPFPPVPDSLSKKGIPIMARFHYVVDTSLVNTLR
jgi:TonB family protein